MVISAGLLSSFSFIWLTMKNSRRWHICCNELKKENRPWSRACLGLGNTGVLPGIGLGHGQELIEKSSSSHVIFQQQRLMSDIVQYVIFGQVPSFSFVNLKPEGIKSGNSYDLFCKRLKTNHSPLLVSPCSMGLLTCFWIPIASQNDVKGVLSDGRWSG